MKALAEQIADLDSMEIYGRVVGVRGLMVEVAGPIHAMSVGARLSIETGIGPAIPCEVVGFTGGHALGHAVRRARRRAARLPGGGRHRRRHHPPIRALARSRGQRHGRADRRPGPVAAGSGALPVPQFAAAGACPHAGGRAARSRRARAQYLSHRLPRPAHGHLFGLGCRQIGAFVDAGPQRGGRHFGDRPGRRARPRGAGIFAGRFGPGRSGALRGGGLYIR
jgi:hypothetical protein